MLFTSLLGSEKKTSKRKGKGVGKKENNIFMHKRKGNDMPVVVVETRETGGQPGE
jgi:hypothetical protein